MTIWVTAKFRPACQAPIQQFVWFRNNTANVIWWVEILISEKNTLEDGKHSCCSLQNNLTFTKNDYHLVNNRTVLSASVKITVGAVFKCSFYDFIEMRTQMQKTKRGKCKGNRKRGALIMKVDMKRRHAKRVNSRKKIREKEKCHERRGTNIIRSNQEYWNTG